MEKSLASIVVVLALLPVSAAQPVGQPLNPVSTTPPPGVSFEQMSVVHDAVFVAKVSEVGEEKSFDLRWAENFGEAKVRFYKLAVTKVLRTAPTGQVKATAASGPAEDKPARERAITEASVWAMDKRTWQGKPVPCLEKDKCYVFFLRKMPKSGGYYMSARHAYAAEEATVKAATDACNMRTWPWSKESGGLKMAMLITGVPERPGTGTVPLDGAAAPPVLSVPCSLAIRNVSKKPLALNLYGPDRVLTVTATGGGAKEFKAQLYPDPAPNANAPEPYSRDFATVVAPGQIVFIGPTTKPQVQWSLPMTGEIGAWMIHVNYTSKRDDKGARKPPLWKGTLETTVPVHVRMKRYGPDEPLPS